MTLRFAFLSACCVSGLCLTPLGCGGHSSSGTSDAGLTGGTAGAHSGTGGGGGHSGTGAAGTGGATSVIGGSGGGDARDAGASDVLSTSDSRGKEGGVADSVDLSADAGVGNESGAADAAARDLGSADLSTDAGADERLDTTCPNADAADAPFVGEPDAGLDVSPISPDVGADTLPSCGSCGTGLTCGGGGDPLRCGLTVSPVKGQVCSPDGWCWMNPRPQGNHLKAVYASSASNIWAVGEAGTVLHFDGTEWSGTTGLMPNRTRNSRLDFLSVWASGPADVWIAARHETVSGNALRTFVLQGDGAHWNEVPLSSTSVVVSIWGTSASDVWLLDSATRKIYRGSSSGFSTIDVPTGVGQPTQIWGLSATEVYVAGTESAYKYNGVSWSLALPKGTTLIWGSAAAGLWANTYDGLVHRIGTTWITLAAPENCGDGLWGTSESAIWFGACYFNGSDWSGPLGSTNSINALSGPAGEGPVGVGGGGVIVNLTSTAGTVYPSPVHGQIINVQATSSNDVWFSGYDDTGTTSIPTLIQWNGDAFTSYAQTAASPPTYTFDAIAAVPGGTPWVNDHHKTWHFSNGTFASPAGAPSSSLYAMWAAASDAIWAVTGKDATIYFYDGNAWQTVSHMLSSSEVLLMDVWGTSKSDVWVVGSSGMTEHWDGSKWTIAATPSTTTIIGVWAANSMNAWAATEGGMILSWDGSQWDTSYTLTMAPLSALRGCSGKDIWAVNDDSGLPLLHQFDGWSWHDSDPGLSINSGFYAHVCCASPGDVWLVNGGSGILRRQRP